MIVFPWREKFISDNFIEKSFNEDEDFVPDFSLFKKLNATEQYYLANMYNWDDGVEVLKWIVQSPKCDKGTAGLIFWRAEPDFYIKHTSKTIPSYEREVFDLLQLITTRFNKNDFKSNRYKFEPGSSVNYTDFNTTYPEWDLSSELQHTNNGKVPISMSLFMNWLAEYQRRQIIKSREARKKKRAKK